MADGLGGSCGGGAGGAESGATEAVIVAGAVIASLAIRSSRIKPFAPRTFTIMPLLTGRGPTSGASFTSVALTVPGTAEMIQPSAAGLSLNCSLPKNLASAWTRDKCGRPMVVSRRSVETLWPFANNSSGFMSARGLKSLFWSSG
jgi:hypothetical protein